MYILDIIDEICPIKNDIKHAIETNFKYIQNIYCLLVVLYASYAVFSNNIDLQVNAIYVVKWQCILEFILCSPDIMLHHFIALCIIYPVTNSLQSINHFLPEMRIVLQTEISTIFLTLRNMIPLKYKTINTINNLLFIIIFSYMRLYQYTKYIIYNDTMYEKITNYYTSSSEATLLTCALYSLSYLNIYWGNIILKTLLKQIQNILPNFQQCEDIIKYMYFTSPLAAFILYKPFENPIYFVDTIGISMLAVSSYKYHNMVAKYDDNKNVLDNNIVWYYIGDVLFINVRCFLCVITNTNINIYTCSSQLYLKMALLFISFIIHLISSYNFVKYILKLKNAKAILTVNDNSSILIRPLNIFNGVPILTDSLIIAFSTGSLYECNNIIFITVIIFTMMSIKPFYQMNHLAFHILLLFQTIFLCQSNLFVNK